MFSNSKNFPSSKNKKVMDLFNVKPDKYTGMTVSSDMFSGTPVSYESLGFGAMVSENTLVKMSDIIKASAKNYNVRELAAKIVEPVQAKDVWGEAEAIYHWVQDHSRYVRDPLGTEMLQSPLVAMEKWSKGQVWSGDCDDFTIILLSLYKSIGYPVALRATGYKNKRQLSHVYGLVNLQGIWYPVDGIKEGGFVGWEAPNWTSVKDKEIR